MKIELSMPLPEMDTKHLLLRQIKFSDAPAMFTYMSDPAVCEHLSWYPHMHQDDTLRYIAMATHVSEDGPYEWALEHKKDGIVIGNAGFHSLNEKNRTIKFSFLISKDYWNKGFMTEASHAMIKYVFACGINRIEAECLTANNASQILLGKLGFLREGIFRQKYFFKQRFHDTMLFALVKSDFAKIKEVYDETDHKH